MSRNDERSGDDSRRLLSGLDSASVPEGMARRAVDRWAAERARVAHPVRRLVTWPRVALAASLLVLVLLVHTHLSHEPRPAQRTQTARVVPAPVRRPQPREQRGKPTPPAPRTQLVRRPAPPPAPRPKAPAPRRETPAPTTVATRAEAAAPTVLVGSAADMAYLNREAPTGEDAEAGVTVLADLRLATPVSLTESGEDMSDLMGALRARTGVDIVLPDEVAQTRLALLCKERPLRDVLRQMGRAVGLRWYRSGVGYASRYAAEPGPDAALWTDERPAPGAGARDLQRLAQVTGLDVIGDPNRVRAALSGTYRPVPVEGWLVLSAAR